MQDVSGGHGVHSVTWTSPTLPAPEELPKQPLGAPAISAALTGGLMGN